MTKETNDTFNFFKSEAYRCFLFICDHGFRIEEAGIDKSRLTTALRYVGKNIAVVLQFDIRTEFTACYVVKVSEGKIDWDGGQYQLFSYLLQRCGYRGRMLDDTSAIGDVKERIRMDLERYASVLKSHGERILADSDIFG